MENDQEGNDGSREATRFGSSQPGIAKSAGTGEEKFHGQPDPAIVDLNRARKEKGSQGTDRAGNHVADAGDAG